MIPFLQYLRPNGNTLSISIERPDTIEAMARSILVRGYRFEAEMLQDGDISLTIFDRANEEDVAIELCRNGPAVVDAVDRLITNFHTKLATMPKASP